MTGVVETRMITLKIQGSCLSFYFIAQLPCKMVRFSAVVNWHISIELNDAAPIYVSRVLIWPLVCPGQVHFWPAGSIFNFSLSVIIIIKVAEHIWRQN